MYNFVSSHTERVERLRGVEAFRLALTARSKTPLAFRAQSVRRRRRPRGPDDRRLPQCLSDLEHTIGKVTQGSQNGQGDIVDGHLHARDVGASSVKLTQG